jgi:hypothetical protein
MSPPARPMAVVNSPSAPVRLASFTRRVRLLLALGVLGIVGLAKVLSRFFSSGDYRRNSNAKSAHGAREIKEFRTRERFSARVERHTFQTFARHALFRSCILPKGFPLCGSLQAVDDAHPPENLYFHNKSCVAYQLIVLECSDG